MAMADAGPDRAWDEVIRALDPAKVAASLRRELGRGYLRIGERFVAIAVKAIQAGEYAPNSEITAALKGSTKALVNDGDLMAAITYDVDLADMAVWLGANKAAKRKSKGGREVEMINLVRVLHDGGSVDVSKYPQVRQAVFARLRDIATGKAPGGDRAKAREILDRMAVQSRSKGGSGGGGMGIWIIPSRPFIEAPIGKPEFEAVVDHEVGAAVDRALRSAVRAHLGGMR